MEGREVRGEGIAIVGIACQFPGARDLAELHELTLTGRRMFRPVPGLPGVMPRAALLDGWGADGPDDHGPLRKLAAETAALALADAALPSAAPPRTALPRTVLPRTDLIVASSAPGVAESVREALGIASTLDLPAAASLSSLHAVAAACDALRRGDLDIVVAGGAELGIDSGWLTRQAASGLVGVERMLVYDSEPVGFLPGDGCGVVVLMRSADARVSRRPVYAEIAGWVTAPAPNGTARPYTPLRAYDQAGTEPADIGLVEGHGAGTAAADGEELATLARLRHDGAARAPLGAVSACIGHSRAASGVASLIKTVAAMVAGTIPPGTGCPHPHPLIESGAARLRLPAGPEPWPDGPRLAAVNSLGIFGHATDGAVHLVLRRESDRGGHHGRRRRPADPVAAASPPRPGPPAHAAPAPRAAHAAESTQTHELTTSVHGRHTAPASTLPIRIPVQSGTPQGAARNASNPVVFALCGAAPGAVAGTLDVIAASATGRTDPEVRDLATHMAAAARHAADNGAPLRVAFAAAGPGELSVQARRAAQLLKNGPVAPLTISPGIGVGIGARGRVVLVFPGLAVTPAEHGAVLSAALHGIRALDTLNVTVRAGVGYSAGEIAALVWAGCLPPAEAARLAASRGQVLRGCANRPAAMARVVADLDLVRRLCTANGVHLAACETATSHLVAGPGHGIRNLARLGIESGVAVDVLKVSTAVHSPALAGCTAPLRAVLAAIPIGPPRRTVISTITGEPLAPDADIAGLLAGQLRQPVLFAQAIALAAAEADVLMVAGPDGDPASPHAPAQPGQRSLSTLATAASGVPALRITDSPAHVTATMFAAGAINAVPQGLMGELAAGLLPVRPQRHVRLPVRVQPHAEHLVQLDLVPVKTQP